MRSLALAGILMLSACSPEAAPIESPTAEASAEPPPAHQAKDSDAKSVRSQDLHFAAHGTEPFWSVDVQPGKLVYSTPESPKGRSIAVTMSMLGDRQVWSGTHNSKPVILAIESGACSDGMSDTVFDWSAVLKIEGQTLKGCASLK